MQVTLTIDDVLTAVDHGSVVAITGTDENGRRVTFAGDVRPMNEVMSSLIMDLEDEVTVEVEDWQLWAA
jgi:hypothetical protein